ncbi:MAG: family N-acetyltransferase [Frankiales bacterium]|nr:family N-acetyltransferase [Frankiales bacterium]
MDLDLDDTRAAALATTLEQAARALGSVRYGRVLRLAAASVVLNPDSPLASANHASTFVGGPGAVETALLLLPEVWAEVGLPAVHVVASPASAPELGLLCEELEYEAVEETSAMLLTDPARLVEGEPGIRVRPVPEEAEDLLPPLLAEGLGWRPAVARRQRVALGHRLDDARHLAVGAWVDGELVGVATGFRHGAVGQVVDVVVAEGHRRRGLGRALVSAVAASHLTAGASLVWLSVEAGGRAERACELLGFATAYEAVTYVLPLEA